MSPDPSAPVDLSFGDAYERLQQVASELGADQTMAPDRLIALLREGKGLERALREHLDRVEQDVRAIEAGEGAVPFRIVGGAPAPADAGPATTPTGAPEVPVAAAPPAAESPASAPPAAAPRTSAPAPEPPGPPTLGFADDDDIPF